MKVNTLLWNKIRYTLYAPIYDMIDAGFRRSRTIGIQQLAPQAGEHVLLIGCGTGLDLELLPNNIQITAIDLTPAMIRRAQRRAIKKGINADIRTMNAEQLSFANEQFDCVILHLILAVVPDPVACIEEANRVLKPGGRISILDKFLENNKKPSIARRILNIFSNILATNINRQVEPLLDQAGLTKIQDTPVLLGHTFRAVIAVKSK